MSCKEQKMSKDKYPSTFSPQMEAIVFIILQIFFATREQKYLMDYDGGYGQQAFQNICT